MISKNDKNKVLERFNDKEERILISNILDKAYRFEKTDKLEYTSFLNLNEFNTISCILNELKVKYIYFDLNGKLSRKIIFFVPEYIEKNETLYSNYISVLKIIPNVSGRLTHKDYMGAVYSLGLKHEVIGDIFVTENQGYIFCLSSVSEYIRTNLFRVGNQEIEITQISLFSNEINSLEISLEKKEYIVASLRVDAVLSVVYNLSRSEVKARINQGNLYINDKNEYYLSQNLEEGDIVSFRKCGKLKIGKKIRKTRSDRTVIEIFIYS